MENASKALIIAGAILLSILIIAIGMYVYTSAQSTINDSLTKMSSSEKSAFNATFTGYQGKQTGSQIKSLINDLTTNSSTYIEEPAKIVQLEVDKINSKGDTPGKASRPDSANSTDDYIKNLNSIRNQIENKHVYWVDIDMNTEGIVDTISIKYNPNDAGTTEPTE